MRLSRLSNRQLKRLLARGEVRFERFEFPQKEVVKALDKFYDDVTMELYKDPPVTIYGRRLNSILEEYRPNALKKFNQLKAKVINLVREMSKVVR